MTSAMPVHCSTNSAMKALSWDQVNLLGSFVPMKDSSMNECPVEYLNHFSHSSITQASNLHLSSPLRQIDLLSTEWLHSSVGRALYWHRRGSWVEVA